MVLIAFCWGDEGRMPLRTVRVVEVDIDIFSVESVVRSPQSLFVPSLSLLVLSGLGLGIGAVQARRFSSFVFVSFRFSASEGIDSRLCAAQLSYLM